MINFVYVAIISAILAAAGTWRVEEWRFAANEKDRIEQQAKETARKADKIDVAAAGHEADKKAIQKQFTPLQKEVEHVVQAPSYNTVCIDDSGMRVLSSAIHGTPTASEPAGAVPGLKRPGRWDWQSNASMVSSDGKGL